MLDCGGLAQDNIHDVSKIVGAQSTGYEEKRLDLALANIFRGNIDDRVHKIAGSSVQRVTKMPYSPGAIDQ